MVEILEEVAKHILLAEYQRIFGIKTEHHPYAKHIEVVQKRGRDFILVVQSNDVVVKFADKQRRLFGNGCLQGCYRRFFVQKKFQTVIISRHSVRREWNYRWWFERLVAVVDFDGAEVGADDVTRLFLQWQPIVVTLRLLKWRKSHAVALWFGTVEGDVTAFLFY